MIDKLSQDVFLSKYAAKGEKTPADMWKRLALFASSNEKDRDRWARTFYWMLEDFKFIPAGRILFGAGNPDYKSTVFNCFVIPIKEDSLDGIFDAGKEAAKTYSRGGGVGIDISILRPAGAKVNNSAKFSTGAWSFMEFYSFITGMIGQNNRRGALLLSIDISHPDVEFFINSKSTPNNYTREMLDRVRYMYSHRELGIIEKVLTDMQVRFANISIKIRDEFMKKVEENDIWELWYPDVVEKFPDQIVEECYRKGAYICHEKALSPYDVELVDGYILFECHDGKVHFKGKRWEVRKKAVYKRVKARELWNNIVESAWKSGDPGVLFWDEILRNHNPQYFQPALCTNPCSEKILSAYSNCCLGSLNLTKFITSQGWNYLLLEKVIKAAVRFLDNIIELSDYPLDIQRNYGIQARRLGLGFTGLADAFAMMGIKYGSDESIELAKQVTAFIRDISYRYSVELSKEKGSFESFNRGFFQSQFVQQLPEDIKRDIEKYGIRNSEIISIAPTGSISLLAGLYSSGIEPFYSSKFTRFALGKLYSLDLSEVYDQDVIVTAFDLDIEKRILLQASIQKYVDSSISSTINLKNETDTSTISDIYKLAWKSKNKGITVFRDGCKSGVIVQDEICPKCQKTKKKIGGCSYCETCMDSQCEI